MPRLNSLGDALTGVAGGITAVNGSTPTALVGSQGGGWEWLNDTDIIGQANIPSLDPVNWYIYTVAPYTALTATLEVAEGANNIKAGGDVWEKWWTNGVTTNVVAVPSLPNAGPGYVDRDGTWCVCTVYATGSGITVYDNIGTVLNQINVSLKGTIIMRDGLLAYDTLAGWPLVAASTGTPVAGYVQQVGTQALIPLMSDDGAVVVEYNGPLVQWTVRKANEGTGLIIATADPNMFGVDATILASGILRVAWSTGAGELPAELVVMDIDTTNGTTEVGTVVAGSLVFNPGPTLEGSRFSMASVAAIYLPYNEAVNDPETKGRMSDTWLASLRGLRDGVSSQGSTAAASGGNPPIPPATFQAEVLVSTTPVSGFPLARVVTNSATVEWDFSVPNSATANVVAVGGQYMPVFVGGLAVTIGDDLVTIFWTPPES